MYPCFCFITSQAYPKILTHTNTYIHTQKRSDEFPEDKMLEAWDTVLGDTKHHWNRTCVGGFGGFGRERVVDWCSGIPPPALLQSH
jgi:hypothetical protein